MTIHRRLERKPALSWTWIHMTALVWGPPLWAHHLLQPTLVFTKAMIGSSSDIRKAPTWMKGTRPEIKERKQYLLDFLILRPVTASLIPVLLHGNSLVKRSKWAFTSNYKHLNQSNCVIFRHSPQISFCTEYFTCVWNAHVSKYTLSSNFGDRFESQNITVMFEKVTSEYSACCSLDSLIMWRKESQYYSYQNSYTYWRQWSQ